MKALVVGGSSFIGNVLVEKLSEGGNSVIATYNNHPIEEDKSKKWVKIDINNENEVKKLMEYDFDTIFHVASLSNDTGNADEMVRVNINGLQNILNIALKKKVGKFILSSSTSAYEWYPESKFVKPDYLPVDEKHPCRPKNIYATTKRMQELLALTYHYQYELPVTALRITAVIGPRGSGGGKMWREFAESMKKGKEIQLPVFTLKEVQHFVDIRDVAELHIEAARNKNSIGEIFNCCGPRPTSGEEFVNIIKKIYPKIKVELGFPWSLAQGGKLYFDMSKSKKLLNFEPKYDVFDSISNIKEWVDKIK